MSSIQKIFNFFILISISIFISCGGKKGDGSEDIWVAPEPTDTIAYTDQIDTRDTLIIDGSRMMFHIVCEANDSMPIVTSYSGQRYKDNTVDLTVRNDSSQIFKRHFTKNSFNEFVSESKLKNMSLVSFYLNYSKTDSGSKLYFLCKIGDPEDTDENFNFIEIQISRGGEIHMEKAKWEELTTEPLDNAEFSELSDTVE